MARANLKKDFRDGDKLYGQQLNNNFSTIEAALDAMNKIAWQDDPDESVTAFRGTTAELQEQPIIDGQLLYDISTGETYIDYNGERISTGSGNSIHIGADTPTNEATQIWIDPTDTVTNIGTEVINNLDGDETHMAPSVYAIKSANTYSTEEVKTGDTWIDGKPIYRIVYTGNTPSSENSWTNLNQIPNTINEITNFYGTVYETNGKYNNINFGEGSYYIHTAVNTNTHYIMMIQKGWGSLSYKIVIEYTKTTDGSDS